ncbi:MAG TPA: type II CAAX endopeptidase family protein [Candidatus Angelobacter sp.]|nr:type II CAAX endopeptidase family protein [Candidatus Angelobacter sp.]
MPATRQLGLLSMLGLWAVLTLTGVLYATWQGYGGRELAATLTAFAFLFLVMLLFAARGMDNGLLARYGPGAGYLLGALVFLVYLIYALGTNSFAFGRAATVAGLVLIPLALATSASGKPAGVWQDFATIVGIWVAVKPFPNLWGFSMSHWLWPYPGGRLAYVLTVLLCVNIALAVFVLVRRVPGIGYSIGWGRHWSFFVLSSFIVFACLAIPLARTIHFIQFDPHWSQWKSLPFVSLGILFFTAWPEELLFRGLLQNLLARASSNDLAGWWIASILFGFSHITNLGFPNWRYVLLASIAGFFYGWTWRKTGSIFASALVHAAVDILWHFLFSTL